MHKFRPGRTAHRIHGGTFLLSDHQSHTHCFHLAGLLCNEKAFHSAADDLLEVRDPAHHTENPPFFAQRLKGSSARVQVTLFIP